MARLEQVSSLMKMQCMMTISDYRKKKLHLFLLIQLTPSMIHMPHRVILIQSADFMKRRRCLTTFKCLLMHRLILVSTGIE